MSYGGSCFRSTLNRFVSADTIVPDPVNPQQFNRYAYSLNNPVNYSDPTGHATCHSLDGTCYAEEAPTISQTDYEDALIRLVRSENQTNVHHNPESTITSPNNGWPDWTYSRWFPDYVTIQASPPIPILGIINVGITIDDYGNVYGSIGPSISIPDAVTGNARVAGGWILSGQEPTTNSIGLDWKSKLGQGNSPTELELENYLTGWSGGPSLSPSTIIGGDIVTTLTNDPLTVGGEVGFYTPQGGAGAAYSVFLYDAGSDTPWFWQKYWGWGVDNE